MLYTSWSDCNWPSPRWSPNIWKYQYCSIYEPLCHNHVNIFQPTRNIVKQTSVSFNLRETLSRKCQYFPIYEKHCHANVDNFQSTWRFSKHMPIFFNLRDTLPNFVFACVLVFVIRINAFVFVCLHSYMLVRVFAFMYVKLN